MTRESRDHEAGARRAGPARATPASADKAGVASPVGIDGPGRHIMTPRTTLRRRTRAAPDRQVGERLFGALAGRFNSPGMAYWMVARSVYLYIATFGVNVRICRGQGQALRPRPRRGGQHAPKRTFRSRREGEVGRLDMRACQLEGSSGQRVTGVTTMPTPGTATR
jgi:hypothetical protein